MTSLALFKRLLSYSFRYWTGFLVAVIGMTITAATETAFPALMKQLMDKGFQGAESFEVWWVPVAVLFIFIGRGVATFLASYSMEWVSNNVLRDLRQAMFEKLILLPSRTFDASSSGQLISKMISEAQQVLFAATNVVTVLIRDSLVLVGLLGWLFWINWKLTLVVVCLMPFLAVVTRKFSKRMRTVSRNYLASVGDMTVTVEEAISGNRVIKVFGGEPYEKKRFANANAAFRGQAMRYAVAAALQTPISQFISAIGVTVVITIALIQTRSGEATIGDFVSFITAMLLMFSPLKHLSEINALLQKGLAAAEGVFKMIDENGEKETGHLDIGRVEGAVEYRNITLRYPTRETDALSDINLKIEAGKTYAFVGPSGGGKTSLVNLLPRLYDFDSGDILIDRVSIRDFTLTSLRRQIALVSQDVVLFNDSIARNIAYGLSSVDEQKIWDAVKAAALKEFIDSLPDGLNTIVGDRGVRISGGQRQRIAIARAFLKDAPILILDEATSALDTQSEASVQSAIDRLRSGRTTLVVAHRLSTIVNADQIVVLSNGKIVQQGNHSQLIARPGVYQSLYAKAPTA
ncbi:lipid A export permease/ATP-binding protein MsbA [beta proteobacterium MWH-UniP1]